MGDDRHMEDEVQAAVTLNQPEPHTAEWLEPVYREHSRTVLRAAYRITGNAQDAEDVLQTVFLRLVRREQAPDLGRGAAAYLRRAATNAALDLVTSKRATTTSPLEVMASEPSTGAAGPDRQQLSHELRRELRRAVATLGRRAAEFFILRYFEDLDNREIAELCDTTPGTVAVTLHRARTHLAAELQSYLGGQS